MPPDPIELAFQEGYGALMTHVWYGDGNIALGFAEGHVIVVSTDRNAIGTELHSLHLFDASGLINSASLMAKRPSLA
eukprot:8047743-Prorocentrum_lima.AAC.1